MDSAIIDAQGTPVAAHTEGTIKQPLNVQYVLSSTDGLLVPCRDKNGQEVYIPFSLLVAHIQKELAKSLRSKGFASVGRE